VRKTRIARLPCLATERVEVDLALARIVEEAFLVDVALARHEVVDEVGLSLRQLALRLIGQLLLRRDALRAPMQEPSFPAAERAQRSVEWHGCANGTFAKGTDIDHAMSPLFSDYAEGVFQKYNEMFKELRKLKGSK
jgi:hypothetical protein